MSLINFDKQSFDQSIIDLAKKQIHPKYDLDLLQQFTYALSLAAPWREKAYLLFTIGKSLNAPKSKLLPFAIVSELIMAAALTVDDVFDNSQCRSGKPSLYKNIGSNRTFLVSEFMFSLAMKIMIDSLQDYNSADITKIVAAFVSAYLDIQKSQYLVSTYGKSGLTKITPATMDYIASLAAGSLFEATTSAVVYFSKDQELLVSLKKIGRLMGMALQHSNDIADFTWSKKDAGKVGLEDLSNNQPNLVLAYFLKSNLINKLDKNYILNIWQNKTPKSAKKVRLIIEKSDALNQAKNHLFGICSKIIKETKKINNMNLQFKLNEIVSLIQDV